MPETLLQTKLYTPPLRPNLVSRPRLIERLNQGLQEARKLTLISTPAGFGKTTLITEWRSHRTDQTEFYQLLTYTDDVNLISKLRAWEDFYNYDRLHISLDGKTPYEVMKSLLT